MTFYPFICRNHNLGSWTAIRFRCTGGGSCSNSNSRCQVSRLRLIRRNRTNKSWLSSRARYNRLSTTAYSTSLSSNNAFSKYVIPPAVPPPIILVHLPGLLTETYSVTEASIELNNCRIILFYQQKAISHDRNHL